MNKSYLKPLFGRLGNKTKILNSILERIPAHDIYIEPFVGGGSVFFGIDPQNIGDIKVINDIDEELIIGYDLINSVSPDAQYIIPEHLEDQQHFVDEIHDNDRDKLIQRVLISSNTFGSKGVGRLYKNYTYYNRFRNMRKYKKRLENTTILCTDYKNVIDKYDCETAFMFLDPPYENSRKDLYKNPDICYNELAEILKNVKGKFMLTINDSPVIREIFKDFQIQPIFVKVFSNNTFTLGGKGRNELIITNY